MCIKSVTVAFVTCYAPLPHCEMPISRHILGLYITALTYGAAKPRKPRLPANFHYFKLTAQYANQMTGN
jgi:hypothetical protein